MPLRSVRPLPLPSMACAGIGFKAQQRLCQRKGSMLANTYNSTSLCHMFQTPRLCHLLSRRWACANPWQRFASLALTKNCLGLPKRWPSFSAHLSARHALTSNRSSSKVCAPPAFQRAIISALALGAGATGAYGLHLPDEDHRASCGSAPEPHLNPR